MSDEYVAETAGISQIALGFFCFCFLIFVIILIFGIMGMQHSMVTSCCEQSPVIMGQGDSH